MIGLRRLSGALSLAGVLLVAVPAVASAADRLMEGPGGTPNATWQPVADHWEHGGGYHRYYRGGGDRFVEFDGYYPIYGHAYNCRYYRRMWHDTGRRFWLWRYERCMEG